jgi:hypothetical protein
MSPCEPGKPFRHMNLGPGSRSTSQAVNPVTFILRPAHLKYQIGTINAPPKVIQAIKSEFSVILW